MSHPTTTPTHPVLACADAIEKALALVAGVDPVYMDTADLAQALQRFTTLASQAEAVRMRLIVAAGEVAAADAARSVADWVAGTTRTDRRVAHHTEKIAHALDARWQHTAAALTAGRVHVEQAKVIVNALEALPRDLDDDLKLQAERQLVADADQFAPADLTRLGRRILDVVAPEIGEDHERKLLEQAERQAEATTRLRLRRRGDGATNLAGTLPDHAAVRLATYLEGYTAPRHRGLDGYDPATGQRLSADRLRGEAFVALLEHLDPARLPDHGGLATTLTITIPVDTLLTGLGTAELPGTDLTITAGQARRLACTAGLVPAVLGTHSEVLDLGRTARLYKPAQRKALALQHPSCRAEGCSVAAAWCESHHHQAWSRGGRTDLNDGVLLCHWHHKRAHDDRYQTKRMANGDYRYHRRT